MTKKTIEPWRTAPPHPDHFRLFSPSGEELGLVPDSTPLSVLRQALTGTSVILQYPQTLVDRENNHD